MKNEAPDKNKLNRLVDAMLVEMDEYTDKTYGTARFHIADGLYSIEEIEALLVEMKAAKKQTEKSLKRVMKPTKEKNT